MVKIGIPDQHKDILRKIFSYKNEEFDKILEAFKNFPRNLDDSGLANKIFESSKNFLTKDEALKITSMLTPLAAILNEDILNDGDSLKEVSQQIFKDITEKEKNK